MVAAVSALAREVVLNRGKLSDPALAAATSAGLSAEAVLDIVLECALATLVGFIDNLPGALSSMPSSCRGRGRPRNSSGFRGWRRLRRGGRRCDR